MDGAAYPAAWPERIRALARGELDPVTPREAATVLLLKDGDGAGGLSVHMLRRRASMAFAGGAYAYPGGGVDPRDERPVRWAGPGLAQWAGVLGVPERRAQAVVCAAVRETFEESGVLLAGPATPGDREHLDGPQHPAGGAQHPGDSPQHPGDPEHPATPGDPEPPASPSGPQHPGDPESHADRRSDAGIVADTTGPDWEADRRALVRRELGFADFLARRDLVLRSDLLAPWARWITPEFEERRYDTWFFLARLPRGQRTLDATGDGEADRTVWLRPADAVAGYERGEMVMLPPTVTMLRDLLPYPSADEALAAAPGRDLTPVVPYATVDEAAGSVVLSWPRHGHFDRVIMEGGAGR
jgi:8-oxo-dGTP pyrophosphatase MutT (NUDIX family)